MFDYLFLLGFFFALVAVLLIALHDLKWGVFLISALLPAYLLRVKVAWIPLTFLELALYLVLLVALGRLILFASRSHAKRKTVFSILNRFWERTKWLNLLVLMFLVAAVVGVFISDDKHLSLGILKSWFFVPIIYFYLLVFVLDKLSDLKKLLSIMVLPAIFLSVYGLIQCFTGDLEPDGRVRTIFESPNYVSLYLGPLFIVLLGMIVGKVGLKIGQKWSRGEIVWVVFWILGLLSMALVLFLTESYAAWLAIFFGVLVIGFSIPRPKWLYWLLVLAGALLGLATQLSNPKLGAVFSLMTPSSMNKRVETWRVSLEMIKEHWLGGIGLGKFQDLYATYVTLIFPRPLQLEVLHSHNLFLYFWLNLGIIGFLAFLGILGCLVYYFVRLAKNKKIFQKIRLEYFVFLGMLVTILVHGLLDTPYWKNDLSILFWLVVGGVVWLYNFGLGRRAIK